MKVHTDNTLWPELRRLIPNLPKVGVRRCVITLDAAEPVKMELVVYAMGGDGNPVLSDGENPRPITETRRFKIVPDEDPA